MQTPDKYWEGIYWEGVDPDSLNAVPLETASSEDLKTQLTLETCRSLLPKQRILDPDEQNERKWICPSVDDYFVTIQDAVLTEKDRSLLDKQVESREIKDEKKTLCYLWHYRMFLGARDGDSIDPGTLCFLIELLEENQDAAFCNDGLEHPFVLRISRLSTLELPDDENDENVSSSNDEAESKYSLSQFCTIA